MDYEGNGIYNAYNTSVKTNVFNMPLPSMNSMGPVIERDPTNDILQMQVFSQIREIIKPEENIKQPVKNDLQTVSVEDAIKELLALGVSLE